MDNQKNHSTRARGIYLLPNLFTITALFAGFYAIIVAMKGHFDSAATAIFIAMVMDALDGRVARMTHTQTAFGAQLDSLSDMVSFGIAPALVVYSWGLDTLGKFGWIAAFIYAVAGALRLARFNVQHGTMDKRYFKGLPIPMGAGLIASLVWTCQVYGLKGSVIDWIIGVVTILIGLLMVSNLLYRSFKDLDLKNKVTFMHILALVVALVLIALAPPQILLIAFALFALSGPVFWLSFRRRVRLLRKSHKAKKSSLHSGHENH